MDDFAAMIKELIDSVGDGGDTTIYDNLSKAHDNVVGTLQSAHEAAMNQLGIDNDAVVSALKDEISGLKDKNFELTNLLPGDKDKESDDSGDSDGDEGNPIISGIDSLFEEDDSEGDD